MGSANTLEKAIYLKLMGGVGCFPWATGNIFYVDGVNGSNANVGTIPTAPWLTITYALTQCANNNDDYIIVLNHWQEVVAINRTLVHIIGIGHNSSYSWVQMNAAANTAIFTVTADSNDCEIAGFSFGGGAAHGGIENTAGTPMGLYIHDCQFGHSFAGDTPQDGIRIGLNATAIRIENCSFYGNAACGTLVRDGIHWECGGEPLNGTIINNQFIGCPGGGINFAQVGPATGGITIQDNVFACDADTQGAAITLGATCAAFFVVGNRAQFGENAMTANPYLDGAALDSNHWANNISGNAAIYPA